MFKWPCHGLGIVDINELNSYLTIVAIDENIESGKKRRKGSLSRGRRDFIGVRLTSLMSCLACWCHLSVSVVDAASSRHRP